MCDLLHLTYTELVTQPNWFIERMQLWHEAKEKAQVAKQKLTQPHQQFKRR